MPSANYRVTVNGFRVKAETWDDAWEWDGKHDEVFVSVAVTALDRSGGVIYRNEPTSPVLGDTNAQNGRIAAGSASSKGGLITGDSFPTKSPWIQGALSPERDWPPFTVWSGPLTKGESVVTLVPSIWEWDPGNHFFEGWVDWAASIAGKLAPKINDLVGPTAKPIVDAAALGLDVAVTMIAPGTGPVGSSGSRPIGLQQTPGDPTKFNFVPQVLLLNYETAEALIASEPAGKGKGVLSLRFFEHPRFRGDYELFLQVERIGVLPDNRPAQRVSLRSNNFPSRYLRHFNFLYELTPIGDQTDRLDATVELVPGLANPSAVSLRSANFPDRYLRHQDFRVKLMPRTGDALFDHDATFRMVGGLADPQGVSFEAMNFPGLYIRHRNFHVYLEGEKPADGPFKRDATFYLDPPLA